MYYEKYTNNLLTQYKKAADAYAQRIFRPVLHLDSVPSLQTKEHLRTPPLQGLTPIREGESWGGMWQNLWLSCSFTLPDEYEGQQIWLIPHTGAYEVFCFRDGEPCGLVNSKNDFIAGQHSAIYIAEHVPSKQYQVDMECYAGHFNPGGYDGPVTGNDRDFTFPFGGVDVCVMDQAINRMVFDLSTLLQLAQLPENNFLRAEAIRALRDAFPAFIQDPLHHTVQEIDQAALAFCETVAPALTPCEESIQDETRGTVGVIGHSHMDTAWLWPYSETIRKCARTYSEALSLMQRYPEYQFIQSSALHLYWMEKYYPSIFEDIRQRVAEGRYEPNGGVWVECDCNITGAEAMVRQFLYGQQYTREKLGYTSDCFWLPDTFGYNAAIPQIMLQSGVKYFLTQKISWNDLNSMTTDTFRWRGLDGSEVLTHFNVMHTMPDPTSLQRAVDGILDKSTANTRLLAYGFGDGGGGPTYGMLEYLRRARNLPGLPRVRPSTVSRFMQRLDENRGRYPVYDDELYLEFHRGTLTSIHDIKRNNRKAEIALHNLEFLNVASGQPKNPDTEALYKVLLINQFHDILPGSSIAEVNDTARKEMRELLDRLAQENKKYLGTPSDEAVCLVNPTSFEWTEQDVLQAEGSLSLDGALCQQYTDLFGRERTALSGLKVPAYGSARCAVLPASSPAETPFLLDGSRLTTPLYQVEFDECGYIRSLVDRETGREYCRPGAQPLGTFYIGENMPYNYENWELGDNLVHKLQPVRALLSREVVSLGAVECRIRSTYALTERSSISVDTVFYAANRAIEYHAKLDWHDKRHLVKVGFDVDVRTKQVKNEIQFGHMERPTSRNNSFDAAKFEVVNHKWSDLSDSRGGVALINDCKYGISACGSDLRLTLMHGGCRPDPRGDEGVHEMSFALLPHVGPFTTQSVIAPAYKFNLPLLVSRTESALSPLFRLDSQHVVCETVKYAEHVPNAYVLRLYECEGVAETCTLALPEGVSSVAQVNLLEEEQCTLPLENGQIHLSLRPFEIRSLLVTR